MAKGKAGISYDIPAFPFAMKPFWSQFFKRYNWHPFGEVSGQVSHTERFFYLDRKLNLYDPGPRGSPGIIINIDIAYVRAARFHA